MREYHKIRTIFKRDTKTHKVIEGDYGLPEFEYLKNNLWTFTEKINGTNVRVIWDKEKVSFKGRTDAAQMPVFLFEKLHEIFTAEKFRALYPETPMCLYGEGYGAKIQKGGGNYIPDGVGFILFDVLIDGWWLDRNSIMDIASKLYLKVVPITGKGTLNDAVKIIKSGLNSFWDNFQAEGIVLKPVVELKSRNGHRIITKLKHKDF